MHVRHINEIRLDAGRKRITSARANCEQARKNMCIQHVLLNTTINTQSASALALATDLMLRSEPRPERGAGSFHPRPPRCTNRTADRLHEAHLGPETSAAVCGIVRKVQIRCQHAPDVVAVVANTGAAVVCFNAGAVIATRVGECMELVLTPCGRRCSH
jgi:hypothetical protein